MDVARVLTGITLAFVISSINGIAGYGYTIGGGISGAFQVGFSENEKDPRIVVETTEDGTRKIRPKDALSTASIIASSKIGAFGIFLQIFVWLQMIAGLVLIFRKKIGTVLGVFLGFIAVASLATEFVGASLTSSFGITNALGSITAISLAIVTFWMCRAGTGQTRSKDSEIV